MRAFSPDGLSVINIVISSLPFIASFICLYDFIRNFNSINKKTDKVAFVILLLLFFVNFLNIFRGILDSESTLLTSVANPYNALGLLTPLAFGYGAFKFNVVLLNRFLLKLTLFGAIIVFISIIVDNSGSYTPFNQLIRPVIFLICTIPFQSQINTLFIVGISIITSFYVGIIMGTRTTIIRIALLFSGQLMIWLNKKFLGFKMKLFTPIIFISLLLPFLFIPQEYSNEPSVFQHGVHSLQEVFGNDSSESSFAKADTRTFLYVELLDDLYKNGNLLFGKGSSGTYFSPYFSIAEGDSEIRITSEVGFLVILLKGGILAIILNLSLFYIAIYFALFKSNNRYTLSVGLMLSIHTVLLFVENIVAYNLYNFCIWFFVGVCVSSEMRKMSDSDVRNYFKGNI